MQPSPAPLLPRVLVVEDDTDCFELISSTLSAAGFMPIRAKHGDEALSLARSLQPAAITLDLMLPGIDGWGVLKSLKANPATARIPVIIISRSDNRELGLALGVDDYFLKPADMNLLVGRLHEMLPGGSPRTDLLLIDDDPDIHALYAEILEPAGFKLIHATTGEKGITLAKIHPPALVLLDLKMDGMSGFDVAGLLKSDPSTASLPIVVLTAQDLTKQDLDRLHGKIAGQMRKGWSSHNQLVVELKELIRRYSPRPGESVN